jgi:hypothetical protein
LPSEIRVINECGKKKWVITFPALWIKFVVNFFMDAREIKESLMKYIETGDEKLLLLLYEVAVNYEEEKYTFDEKEKEEIRQRWENYKSGKSKALPMGRSQRNDQETKTLSQIYFTCLFSNTAATSFNPCFFAFSNMR